MEKEIGQFALGIKLILYNNSKIVPHFRTTDKNMSKEVIITQLGLFLRMLEDDYYPDFRNNIATINLGPNE